MIEYVAQFALPTDPDKVIRRQLGWAAQSVAGPWSLWSSSDLAPLKRLFGIGVRWKESRNDEIASMRRILLKTSSRAFVDLIKLLAMKDYVAPEILHELARTQAMRKRMRKVGSCAFQTRKNGSTISAARLPRRRHSALGYESPINFERRVEAVA